MTDRQPYITSDLDGIGGVIKRRPEDFEVEEIPLYEPCGQGEHLYVRLARSDRNTRDLAQGLARLFGLKEADVGFAGLKDKRARTVQTFSLHVKQEPPDAGRRIEAELGVEVHWSRRHQNKLKTGHLLGNRFRILVSDPVEDAERIASVVARRLAETGLPNYFGPQRFGQGGDNARRGREILEGGGPRKKWLKKLMLSALQAELFNDYLARRIERGWFDRLVPGDVAKKKDTGGLFTVEDVDAESPRLAAREITYTGPIYGRKMIPARAEAGTLEMDVLAARGLGPADFDRPDLAGGRRPGRLTDLEIDIRPHPDGLVFSFALPKGAYATTLLREFMKTESAALPEYD
jgi:tRNA pseudouridine13 synthase